MNDSSRSPLFLTACAAAAAVVAAASVLAGQRRTPAPGKRRSFAGAAVLITGGSRGFGLALGRKLAAEGARVALVARDGDALLRAVSDLRGRGAKEVLGFVCDVRDQQATEEIVGRVLALFGRIDVLINNAGVIHVAPFAHTQEEDFRDSLDTHFWGPLHLIRASLPSLIAHGGRIINIASVGGKVAVPHLSAYCVGKFALTGLSETLRMELAPYGVSVTTVAPFIMRTGSHRNVLVRGQHDKEALWFALGPSFPFTSIDADGAASQVLEAARARRATVSPGWQSRASELAQHIAPALAASIGSWLTAFLLPAETTPVEGDRPRLSRDLDLRPFSRVFPTKDGRRFNQPIAPDERRDGPVVVTAIDTDSRSPRLRAPA